MGIMDEVSADIYFMDNKTNYHVEDGQVLSQHTFSEHPIVLWDKENCCLADMSDIAYIIHRRE